MRPFSEAREQLVETACIAWFGRERWARMHAESRVAHRTKVRKAFAAIEAQGVRLVPVEPAESMFDAARSAWEDKVENGPLTPAETWSVMLAASPYAPSSNDTVVRRAAALTQLAQNDADEIFPSSDEKEGGQ